MAESCAITPAARPALRSFFPGPRPGLYLSLLDPALEERRAKTRSAGAVVAHRSQAGRLPIPLLARIRSASTAKRAGHGGKPSPR